MNDEAAADYNSIIDQMTLGEWGKKNQRRTDDVCQPTLCLNTMLIFGKHIVDLSQLSLLNNVM